MKLKPPSTPSQDIDKGYSKGSSPDAAIKQILNATGVMDTDVKDADPINEKFKKHLNNRGGTLEDVAQQIVSIMSRGETEASRLRAAEFIAKIHGVQVELDEKPAIGNVTINIQNIGPENRNLVQFVMPKG